MAHYVGSATSLIRRDSLEGVAQRTSGYLRLWGAANYLGQCARLLESTEVKGSAHIQEFLKPGCRMSLYIIGLFSRNVDTRMVLAFEAIAMILLHDSDQGLESTEFCPIATWTILDEIERGLDRNDASLKTSFEKIKGLNHALPIRQGSRFNKAGISCCFCTSLYNDTKGQYYKLAV